MHISHSVLVTRKADAHAPMAGVAGAGGAPSSHVATIASPERADEPLTALRRRAAGAAGDSVSRSGGLGARGDGVPTWRAFYDEQQHVDVMGTGSFAVYTAGPEPSAQTPVVVLLHGANYCAMTFAMLAAQLRRIARVVAYDARCHGLTTLSSPAAALDLSADALAGDCEGVLRAVLHAEADDVPVVLIGHSMGGATAALVASRWPAAGVRGRLAGLVVMDVVEGTALAALPHMQRIIEAMPFAFASVDDAVEWALSSGMLRLPASAEVTLPYCLQRAGAHARDAAPASSAAPGQTPAHQAHGDGAAGGAAQYGEGLEWRWRAERFMRASAPFWEGWFSGTTARFLGCSAPKLLVLADADRLDTALTVAQMQGRFQLALIAGAGHVVHEDAPDKVAECVTSFLSRCGLTQASERALLAHRLSAERPRWGVVSSGAAAPPPCRAADVGAPPRPASSLSPGLPAAGPSPELRLTQLPSEPVTVAGISEAGL
jgi:protein phosphatase methylesterase 1